MEKGKTSATDLDQVVSVLREEAGGLNVAELAHAFQEGTPVLLADKTAIRYLAPSAIDADPFVKIVLFMTTLNTGWDCPKPWKLSQRKLESSGAIASLNMNGTYSQLSFRSRRTGLGCRKSELFLSFICWRFDQMLYGLEHSFNLLALLALPPFEIFQPARNLLVSGQ